MGVVMIRCPRTGTNVSTGLEMDQGTWDALPVVASKMHCPACGAEHVWSKIYAQFAAPGEVHPLAEIHLGLSREPKSERAGEIDQDRLDGHTAQNPRIARSFRPIIVDVLPSRHLRRSRCLARMARRSCESVHNRWPFGHEICLYRTGNFL